MNLLNVNDFKNESEYILACSMCNPGEDITVAAKAKFAAEQTLDVEVFAVGTWNGMPFTINDLRAIANSFHQLNSVLQPPLKFGHNDEQPMTDGQPMLGSVVDLKVAEGKDGQPKLIATFADMPDIVRNAIEKKIYKKVSIELDFGVEYKGATHDIVLTAVALLGADLPAVNTLADLDAYLTRKSPPSELKFTNRKCFTSCGEEFDMATEAELKAEIEKLKAKNASDAAAFAAFKAEQKAKEDAEKRLKLTKHRAEIEAVFDAAIKSTKLTPAKAEIFRRSLGVSDDEKVMALSVDDVKELVGAIDENPNTGSASAKKSGSEDDSAETAGEWLNAKALKFSLEQNKSYTEALTAVMAAYPDKAREHIADSDREAK